MRALVLVIATCLVAALPAHAFDEDHLRQLFDTGACPGCDLRFADLEGTDLADADLAGADLICARLTGANLAGANLNGANLMGADLADADLTGADLRRAVLLRTALLGAIRDDVDLSGAVFFRSMSDGGLAGVDCENGTP